MTHDELNTLLDSADEHLEKSDYAQAEKLARQVLEKVSFPEADVLSAGKGVQGGGDSLRVMEHLSRAHCVLGSCCSNTSHYDESLNHYTLALTAAETSENMSLQALALNGMSTVHLRCSDYQQALQSSNKSMQKSEQVADKRQQAASLNNIGTVYLELSDYPRALEYYQKSLAIADELGNRSSVANNTGNIGIVYAELADYPRALEYFHKALAMDEESGNRIGVAKHTGNIGELYSDSGDYVRAFEYLQRALQLSEEVGSRRLSGYWMSAIASVEHKLGNLDAAFKGLSATLRHRREVIGANEGVAGTLCELGAVLRELGRSEEAVEHLLEALTLAEKLGEKKNQTEAHRELAESYVQLGDSVKALEHHKKFYSLEKEVQSDEAKKQAQNFEHQRHIAEQEKAYAVERAAADTTKSLLYKVLPVSIADRLIAGETRIADYFSNVSILFADISGFTPLSAGMPAHAVVDLLNFVFAEFDRLIKRHGCEKIKTMGDGYMAAAGVPIPCDDHAERIAHAALAMQEDIRLPDVIRKYLPKDARFGIRIGLHTGSAVAGVMGEERFVYDLYSDAVNTAARMEAHGEAGMIHVSQDFAWHLENRMRSTKGAPSFHFEERGEIEVKGKGTMKTYYLTPA